MSSTYIILQGIALEYIGTLGFVCDSVVSLINIEIQFQMPGTINVRIYAGALYSVIQSTNWTINNIKITNSSVSTSNSGGVIAAKLVGGTLTQANIQSSSVITYNNSQSISGGLIGDTFSGIFTQQFQISLCVLNNITVKSQSNSLWSMSAGIIADCNENPITMSQIIVQLTRIQASGASSAVQAAAFVGYSRISLKQIIDSKLLNSNISSENLVGNAYCAGFLASVQAQVQITNSVVNTLQLSISAQQVKYVGIILSNAVSTYITNQVSSEGQNVINGALIQNCASIISQTSESGC
ncbi:Hypothetical_protein [Hexamita inflata]|uniref:Hypothetical_protein n=1 Tax=Hexamita inflata TaxID=28002 RepID=A0AA86TTC9_9EUKA|nr:Hypothetical protein HINF_LOCUS15630 [Hexamita inflata]CAI9927986.1 Hypothetical protein HINF_LOCUS15631 [Hexamita inflata]